MNLTRREAIEQIASRRKEGDFFIKTWEAGHTFVDYDLIDRFMAKGGEVTAIEGFELLNMEQMWQALIDLDPDKLTRVKTPEGEIIEWLWMGSDGTEKKTVYSFDAEGIMTIIDDEFFA